MSKAGKVTVTLVALGLGAAMARPALRRVYPDPPTSGAGEADKMQFFLWLAPLAQQVNRLTGIPASITLAQAWRESKSATHGGYSLLATRYKNLYGMKIGDCTRALATGSVELTTWEHTPGQLVRGNFATFASYYDSTLARALMFYHPDCRSYYGGGLLHRENPRAFLQAIAPSYATDPRYFFEVWEDVQFYDLTRFDVPRDQWRLSAAYLPPEYV